MSRARWVRVRRFGMTHDIKVRHALAAVYAATIPAANWAINHWGDVQFPGGPHTIPVGFGLSAPSGVLFVGLALDTIRFGTSDLGLSALLPTTTFFNREI